MAGVISRVKELYVAYDDSVDKRIRSITESWGVKTKAMFGGICYLLNGNMVCGLNSDGLMLRLHEADAVRLMSTPGAKPFAQRGRTMKGWVIMGAQSFESDDELTDLLELARKFVETLPPKR